jgi:DNA-binding transcriptional ArsR family regulator
MQTVLPGALVRWLRAAGEPTRLRLLSLCTEGAWSVSDLAEALRQSEPRVSRHLRILCEAGLLERLPQGQWVHYRIAGDAEAGSFVRGLLAQLDRRDPLLQGDRRAARSAGHVAPGAQVTESRLGRALAAFVTAGGGKGSMGAVLLVGVAHPELLAAMAPLARQCTALAPSRRAAQAARAFAAQHGLACHVMPVANLNSGGATALERAGDCFDAVLLDHPAVSGEALTPVLAATRRILAPGGRVWLFEPYEALEGARERVVEHPLARLRRLLATAGLACERLSPIEADGEHVLAAAAQAGTVAAQRSQGASR